MTLKRGETEYPLQREFKYTKDGSFETAKTFVLREPKIQHAKKALKLRQMIKKSEMSAASSMQKLGLFDGEDGEGVLGLTAGKEIEKPETMAEQWEKDSRKVIDQITIQLEQSDVDLYKFADIFWKMASQKPTVCLIDGQTPMKEGFRDGLSLEDFMGVPLWYCSFFVTLSDSERKNILEGESTSVLTPEEG